MTRTKNKNTGRKYMYTLLHHFSKIKHQKVPSLVYGIRVKTTNQMLDSFDLEWFEYIFLVVGAILFTFIVTLFILIVVCIFYTQRSVWLETQSFELKLYPDVLKIKKNNCCETAICLLFTDLQIHYLATLMPGCPSCRVARPDMDL